MTVLRAAAAVVVATLAVGTTVVGPSAAATAPTPGYGGIVIQGSGSACAKWHSGITGDEVLNAVAKVGYRQDGLIAQINGSPASAKADDDHYWEYWRTSGGAWTYSSSGASGTSPSAGSVEGWAYTTDGSKRSPSASPAGLYRSLCGSKDASAAPRPTRSSSAPVAPAPRPAPATPTRRSSQSRAGTATPSAGGTSRAPSAAAPSTAGRPGPTSSAPSSGGARRATGSAVFSPTVPGQVDASAVSATSNDSGGSATPVVLGGVLALLLAAGAGLTVLHRRRTDPEF